MRIGYRQRIKEWFRATLGKEIICVHCYKDKGAEVYRYETCRLMVGDTFDFFADNMGLCVITGETIEKAKDTARKSWKAHQSKLKQNVEEVKI